MRLAHLILVHNNPQQLERLILRLSSKSSDVYIHIDKKAESKFFKHLMSLPNVYFIKKTISVGWGDYSMVQATVNSMQEIITTNKDYSHINLLSAQDYPLKRLTIIENYLFQNNNKSFIEYKSIDEDWLEGKNRFTSYFIRGIEFWGRWRLEHLLNYILPIRKIPNNLKPYGYSQWITITPTCAEYVINYLKQYPKVRRFFKMSFGADETLIHTILLNSEHKNSIVNDNLRYIEFNRKEDHPKVLTINDADKLMESGKFFARKFSKAIDFQVLDYIDNKIDTSN